MQELTHFESIYDSELSITLLEMMCDMDPYEINPYGSTFRMNDTTIFMHHDKHVLLYMSSRETLDREGGNHMYSGFFSVDGDEWEYKVESGNWNGTSIQYWEQINE